MDPPQLGIQQRPLSELIHLRRVLQGPDAPGATESLSGRGCDEACAELRSTQRNLVAGSSIK